MAKATSKKNAEIEAITTRALNDFGDLHMSVSGEAKVGFTVNDSDSDEIITIFSGVYTGDSCISATDDIGDALTDALDALGKLTVCQLDGMNPEWEITPEQWDAFLTDIAVNMNRIITENAFEKEYTEQYLVGTESLPIVTIIFKPVANAKVKETVKELKKEIS